MNETNSRRLKVTYLIGSLDVGGAERQLVTLVNRLDRRRFQPRLISLFGGGPLAAELAPHVPMVELSLHRLRETGPRVRVVLGLRLIGRLLREVRKERPDIIHAYLPAAYILGALVGTLLRVPAIVAGRRGLTSYRSYGRATWRVAGAVANRLIRLHVCNSEAVRLYAVRSEGLDPTRTAVVHNGIEPAAWGQSTIPEAWRGEPTAAMVANLIPYKSHDTLLRALPAVIERHPGFRVVLFGDGPARAALTRLTRQLGVERAVTFAGRRPDARELLPDFDLVLLCSTEEGFPNALMEGMAAGRPVVASNVGGVPELVRDGVDGLLYPPGDSRALAGALLELIEDPERRRRMGRSGRERIGSDFSVEAMVRRTEELYERLLESSTASVAEVAR